MSLSPSKKNRNVLSNHRSQSAGGARHSLQGRSPNSQLLKLQSTSGNQAVDGLLSAPASAPLVQTQLRMGTPNDPHELEANRVADQIVNSESSPNEGSEAPPSEAMSFLGRPAQSTVPVEPEVASAVGGLGKAGGEPLAPDLRQTMEAGLGHDLSAVRIHRDQQAADLSSALSARAFTSGQHIAFGKGEYQPGTSRGRHLIAHELTHTLHQSGGEGMIQRDPLPSNQVLEEKKLVRVVMKPRKIAPGTEVAAKVAWVSKKPKGPGDGDSGGVEFLSTERAVVSVGDDLAKEFATTLAKTTFFDDAGKQGSQAISEALGLGTDGIEITPLEIAAGELKLKTASSDHPLLDQKEFVDQLEPLKLGELKTQITLDLLNESLVGKIGGKEAVKKVKELKKSSQSLKLAIEVSFGLTAEEIRQARRFLKDRPFKRFGKAATQLEEAREELRKVDPKKNPRKARQLEKKVARLERRFARLQKNMMRALTEGDAITKALKSPAGRKLATALKPIFTKVTAALAKLSSVLVTRALPIVNIVFMILDAVDIIRAAYYLATGKARFGLLGGGLQGKPGNDKDATGTAQSQGGGSGGLKGEGGGQGGGGQGDKEGTGQDRGRGDQGSSEGQKAETGSGGQGTTSVGAETEQKGGVEGGTASSGLQTGVAEGSEGLSDQEKEEKGKGQGTSGQGTEVQEKEGSSSESGTGQGAASKESEDSSKKKKKKKKKRKKKKGSEGISAGVVGEGEKGKPPRHQLEPDQFTVIGGNYDAHEEYAIDEEIKLVVSGEFSGEKFSHTFDVLVVDPPTKNEKNQIITVVKNKSEWQKETPSGIVYMPEGDVITLITAKKKSKKKKRRKK